MSAQPDAISPATKTQPFPQTGFQYDRFQRWLHWSMAILIFVAIGVGVAAAYVPVGEVRRTVLGFHKSLGFTAVILLVIRIGYRMFAGEPPYRQPLDRMTHLASRAGHLALYGLMVAMPITGYMFSAAGGYPLPWFGLFELPRLLPLDKAISGWGEFLHDRGAWVISGLLLMHLAAVAWHHWIKRDEVLSRMTGR